MNKSDRQNIPAYEAILLSQIISEKKQIRITFLDGDILIERVRWYTSDYIGLKDGKVVNKQAIKFWESLEEFE